MDDFFQYEAERVKTIDIVNNVLKRKTGVPNIINNAPRISLKQIIDDFCYECYDRETYVLIKINSELISSTCDCSKSSCETSCASTDSSDKGSEESEENEENEESEESEESEKSFFINNYAEVLAIYGYDFCDCRYKPRKNHKKCLQEALAEIKKNAVILKQRCYYKTRRNCTKENHLHKMLQFDYSGKLFLCGLECYDCIFERDIINDNEYDDYNRERENKQNPNCYKII